jgi:hypothetical protein
MPTADEREIHLPGEILISATCAFSYAWEQVLPYTNAARILWYCTGTGTSVNWCTFNIILHS